MCGVVWPQVSLFLGKGKLSGDMTSLGWRVSQVCWLLFDFPHIGNAKSTQI